MPRAENNRRFHANGGVEEFRLSPVLLLFSADDLLVRLVCQIVGPPWRLVRSATDQELGREVFAQPNIRLVIFDDQAVEESERGRLLEQIRRRLSGAPLIYVAASQSDANEKRARARGAQYYVSKPLSADRFGHVLSSFLQAQQTGARGAHPASHRTS